MHVPEDPHSISDVEHLLSQNLQSKTAATAAPARIVPRARAIHSDFLDFEVHSVPEDLGCVWMTDVEACVVILGAYWGTGDG